MRFSPDSTTLKAFLFSCEVTCPDINDVMSTKKLAKELGLLRQRSQSSNGLKKSLISNQIFSHLIVIDFESTCWREKNNYSQEIIEFPAVLLNTSTGEVESEFHTYVQPQEHPILSAFCTELTGITQMQVEAGIPLQICLSRFGRWLQDLQLSMGVVFPDKQPTPSAPSASQKLCTFLTWSDWDLGVCLQYECKRKQLHKPDVLNSWIDLRSTYRLFYDRKPKGLNGALQDLGIQFAGREHSGLDDSRNTAQLAARMMRDGCVMRITRSLARTPVTVKPMFGNTTADNKKEGLNRDKEEKTLTTNKPSLSTVAPKSCRTNSCSKFVARDSDKKESPRSVQESVQTCESLVSPKTLLNGMAKPLGGQSVAAEVVTNASPLVMRNCPPPHNNNNNSLVLCSTTVGCLPNQPRLNQPSRPGATVGLVEEEERAELFLLETEERCGYDDVVLEGDDGVAGGTERECDVDYVSGFDSGCHVWEEPAKTCSPGGQLTSADDARESTSVVSNVKRQEMTSEPATTSLSKKPLRSHVNVWNRLNEIRQHSTISGSSPCFALPKHVSRDCKLNQHKTGLKTSLQIQEKSHGPHKSCQTNTPLPFRQKPFMPEKTSTPNFSFARPRAVVTQHTNRKEAPKSSFTIYTDPVKPSRPSSDGSFCNSRDALSSRTNHSSVSVSLKGGQRVTSPLCACGRRAKRQVVSNGGPNHGRGFYCCPVRRSGSGGRVQKGCEFFKWESSLIKGSSAASPAVGCSVSLCQFNASPSCRPSRSLMIRKSY